MRILFRSLVVIVALFAVGVGLSSPASGRRHVVLISLDGLRPDLYLHPEKHGLKLPNLRKLMANGSYARAVTGVYPSVTYPSHTTLVTGVLPAKHGIIGNEVMRPDDPHPPWYFEHKAIKVKTLFAAAHEAGLKTAAISWPVTVGAPVDWLIPEFFDTKRQKKNVYREVSTPGLYERIEEKYGAGGLDEMKDWAQRDAGITDCAEYIIGQLKPQFIAVHIIDCDHQQHETGLDTPETRKAFMNADAQVGRILDAVEYAGLRRDTTVIVTGDHGFAEVHSVVAPNVILHQAGLQELEGDRVTSWEAYVWTHGAAGGVYVKDAKKVSEVRQLFEAAIASERQKPLRLISRRQLDELGAFPGAAFGLECSPGFRMSRASSGEFGGPSKTKGMHGYLPTNPAMKTGFIISGAGARRGVVLPEARMIDIAPTAAKLLRVRLPAAGTAIDKVLAPAAGRK